MEYCCLWRSVHDGDVLCCLQRRVIEVSKGGGWLCLDGGGLSLCARPLRPEGGQSRQTPPTCRRSDSEVVDWKIFFSLLLFRVSGLHGYRRRVFCHFVCGRAHATDLVGLRRIPSAGRQAKALFLNRIEQHKQPETSAVVPLE